MKKKLSIILAVSLTLILSLSVVAFAAPSPVPGADQNEVALAAESDQCEEHCIQAKQEQLDKIKELWGKDITLGEVLGQAFPEVLEGMPQNHAHMFEGKMPWAHMRSKDEVSGLEVCWNYCTSEDAEQAWVWFGSEGKQIYCIAGAYIHKPEPDRYVKGCSFSFDEQGKPIFGPVFKVEESEFIANTSVVNGSKAIYDAESWTWGRIEDLFSVPPHIIVTGLRIKQWYKYEPYPGSEEIVWRKDEILVDPRAREGWRIVNSNGYYTNDDPPQPTTECHGWGEFEDIPDINYWHVIRTWNTAFGRGGCDGYATIEAPNGLPPNTEFYEYVDWNHW